MTDSGDVAAIVERDFVAAWWLLATLQASTMGRSVYERLGFRFVCDFVPYHEA